MKIPELTLPPVRKDALTKLIALALSGRAMSRSEWANRTGVSLTTTGKVARALLEAGVITEQVPTQFRSGRRTGLLRTNPRCHFLSTNFHEDGCLLTVTDGWDRIEENIWLPKNEDLTEEENHLLFRGTFMEKRKQLEDRHPLVGSVLIVTERELGNPRRREALFQWGADWAISEEESVRGMIEKRFQKETVYFFSTEWDRCPVLYAQGREVSMKSLPTRSASEGVQRLSDMLRQWQVVEQLIPNPRLILHAPSLSPAEEELIRKRLPAKENQEILRSPDLELIAARDALKNHMAECLAMEKSE